MPEVELVGLLTLNNSEAIAFAQEFGVANTYADLDTMLEQSKADLIDIVSPPQTHAPFIRACVDKQCAVICQKPFCASVDEANEVVDYISAKSAFVAVHENFRFQPWYQQIKSIINEGLLGDIYDVNFDFRPGDGQGEQAYLDRQPYFQTQERFFIQETGVHFIDVFRFLFGDITGLFARLAKLNPVIAGEDAGLVFIEFDTGVRGVLNGNRLSDHAATNTRLTMGEMRISGSLASLTLNGDGQIHTRKHGSSTLTEQSFEWNNIDFGGDCVYQTNKHIADHLLYGKPVQNLAHDYLTNRQIEDAIYRSAKSESWVRF